MGVGESGDPKREGGKNGEGIVGVKRIKIFHLQMYGDSIKKPTKYCFYKGGREFRET